VGLAVHLDDGADLPVVDVGTHQALGGGAAGLLRRTGDALLPEPLLGPGEVALALGEGLLAVHHPGPGLLPELSHHRRSDLLGHRSFQGGSPGEPGPRWDYSAAWVSPSPLRGSCGAAAGSPAGAVGCPLISTVGPRRSTVAPRGPRSRSGRRPKRRSSRSRPKPRSCWLSCSSRSLAPEAR